MTSQQHTIFSIKFNHNGTAFETKALKYTYRHEVMYKVAMPSAASPVQQCWLALNKAGNWNLVMGDVNPTLMQHLITAIRTQESIAAIYTASETKQELKSA